MEELIAGNDEGSKRVKEASERKDQWLAKQVRNRKKTPTEIVVVDADVMQKDVASGKPLKDTHEDPENAEPSERVAISGKEYDREQEVAKQSTAMQEDRPHRRARGQPNDDPMTPVSDKYDSLLLDDGEEAAIDIRMISPERAPPVKRRIEAEDESRGDGTGKVGIVGNTDVDIQSLSQGLTSIVNMAEDEKSIVTAAIFSVYITDVLFPASVNEVAAKFGLVARTSFDITNGWGFSKDEHRARARKRIKAEDTYCVIGPPPCALFAMLMELVETQHKGEPEWAKKRIALLEAAIGYVVWWCMLYRYQLKRGKHFIHGHALLSRSWGLECIKELVHDLRIFVAYGNMCQFDMTAHIDTRHGPRGLVAKPTGFCTSSWTVHQ